MSSINPCSLTAICDGIASRVKSIGNYLHRNIIWILEYVGIFEKTNAVATNHLNARATVNNNNNYDNGIGLGFGSAIAVASPTYAVHPPAHIPTAHAPSAIPAPAPPSGSKSAPAKITAATTPSTAIAAIDAPFANSTFRIINGNIFNLTERVLFALDEPTTMAAHFFIDRQRDIENWSKQQKDNPLPSYLKVKRKRELDLSYHDFCILVNVPNKIEETDGVRKLAAVYTLGISGLYKDKVGNSNRLYLPVLGVGRQGYTIEESTQACLLALRENQAFFSDQGINQFILVSPPPI